METITAPTSALKKRTKELEAYIGHTPLFPLRSLQPHDGVDLYAKMEWQQFGGSVKARPAYRIIRDAIERGDLGNGQRLLDATSGNTGIAYAHIGAALNIPVTLFMPENASTERKRMLRSMGVDLRFTDAEGGTDLAQDQAQALWEREPDRFFYADQYSNPSNWRAHYDSTGPEVWKQTKGRITHFVAGLGTTGTFTGTGRRLKEKNENIELIALQPELAMHGMEGWKHLETAHVPSIYDEYLPDTQRRVSTEAAYDMIKRAARDEGLLLSPSSAANIAGAHQVAEELDEGVVVTVLPDDASKYGEVIEQLFNA